MKKYILLLLMGIPVLGSKAQPPNNAIFYGGNGEGSSAVNYAVTSVNIFAGSAGDGSGLASNNAASNQIFTGGEGEGFSSQSNNAVSNNIFLGSGGDGFANNINVSVPNDIFKGGGGDGWNAVIFPMGPLPVKLLSFTAEHAGKAHLVKWVTTEEINTKHFELQRSANGSQFETAAVVNPSGSPSSGASYRFTVHEPWQGNNFYRLKIVDTDGSMTYSNIVLLKNDGSIQVSVYPNPAAQQLFVKMPVITGVVSVNAIVTDANGKTVLQTVFKPGIANAVDVSRLAAGVYTLQCNLNNQPVVLRFVKSN